MHQRILILFIFVLENIFCISQNYNTAYNIIYLELGGNGGYGSCNYERVVFSKNKIQLSTRIGFSLLKIKDYHDKFNPDIAVPFAINLNYGKNHKIEIGAGTTFANRVTVGDNQVSKRKSDLHGNLHIGYRYQKVNGGLILRISYTPLIEFFTSFRHWAGVSIGYAF